MTSATAPSTPADSAEEEMTPLVFAILRDAVNLARSGLYVKAAPLRARLSELHPGEEPSIAAALSFWAKRVQDAGGQ